MKNRLLIESDFDGSDYDGLDDNDEFDSGSTIDIGNGFTIIYGGDNVLISKNGVVAVLDELDTDKNFRPYLVGFCNLLAMNTYDDIVIDGLMQRASWAMHSAVFSTIANQ